MGRHSAEKPNGLSDEQLTRNDMSYSPASEREVEELQRDPGDSPATDDVESARIGNLPGTGGPDDTGDLLPPADERDERDERDEPQ